MKYSEEVFKKELREVEFRDGLSEEERNAQKAEICRKFFRGLEVGDGVTVRLWSDAHAGTVIKLKRNVMYVQQDIATRLDDNGWSSYQEYAYERNTSGRIYKCYWSEKYGCFFFGGTKSGKPVIAGRYEFYDYNF